MKARLVVIAFLLAACATQAQVQYFPPAGGTPNKIVGTGGATVDVSSGNVAIAAQAGGALNVNNGPSYFPDKIDLVSQPSPILSGAGHFSLNLDAYQNPQFSVNGGAYQPMLVGLPYAITAKSANFTVDWSTVASGTLFNVTTGTSTITATFSNGTTGKIIGLAKADSASGHWTTSPAPGSGALGGYAQGYPTWLYYDGSNYQVLSQAGIVTMDASGAVSVPKGIVTITAGIRTAVGSGYAAYYNSGYALEMGASNMIRQASGVDPTAADVGFMRVAPGQWSIFDGSTNTNYRDLILRYLTTGGSSGTQVKLIKSATATWDPASLADGASETKTGIPLTGIVAGDKLVGTLTSVNADTNPSKWRIQCEETAADTAACTITNNTGGTVDLASGTLRVSVIQF